MNADRECTAPADRASLDSAPLRAAGRALRRFACFALLIATAPASAAADAWIQFGGCRTTLDGPVCILEESRTLVLWLDAAAGGAEFRVDGRRLQPVEVSAAGSGERYVFELPARARRLDVRPAAGGTSWRLALATETDPAWLEEANGLFRAGELEACAQRLQQILESADAGRRSDALGLLGKVHYNLGDLPAAQAALADAVAASAAAGRRYDSLRNALVLAHSLQQEKRFSAAREVLDAFAEDAGGGQAEAAYFLAYHRGLAAANAGDARGALRLLGAAADVAVRFGWQRRRLNAEQLLAVQLQQLGRRGEARALLDDWRGRLPPDLPPCEEGLYHTNVGWNLLLALEAGEPAADPVPALERALALVGAHCLAAERANAHVNLALAWLHAGDTLRAAEQLAQARLDTQRPDLRLVLWVLDIEARIAARSGDTALALAHVDRLERLASATLSPTARWRAAVRRAQVLEQAGDVAGALAAFDAAQAVLEEDVFRVPLAEGRESLTAARDWATRRHLGLLLAAGDIGRAHALARRARARVLHSLSPADQVAALDEAGRRVWEKTLADYRALREEITAEVSQRWAVPRDELAQLEARLAGRRARLRWILDAALAGRAAPASIVPRRPDAGELLLAFHALDSGWAVFFDDGEELRYLHRPCSDDGALAACLLEPLAPQIAAADLLVLLPTGALNQLDFHAAEIGGEPLLARLPVVYSADLPAASGGVPSGGRALLVADPLGDLAGARVEAGAVASILGDQGGWSLQLLSGAAADATGVQRLLGGADLFHYAGHAWFGGTRGWDSQLDLADDTALTVTDILALAAPPPLVVLSGCETAAVAAGRLSGSMGLANAFLAGGSAAVVATARPVPDRLTGELMRRFYDAWTGGRSLADALRGAQLSVRASRPEADWAAPRLIVRR